MTERELDVFRYAPGEYRINGWRVRRINPFRWDMIATDGQVMFTGTTLTEVKGHIREWLNRS